MRKALQHTDLEPRPKHQTMTPYVIGFVLSLVFTLIPYFMVVQKVFKGSALLATIIGFAVLQLVIQVVFFLHIGREKKPRFNLLFLISTIGIIMVVVLGSIWIMNHLHYNMAATDVTNKVATDEAVHHIDGEQVGTCSGTGKNHKIELQNNTVTPRHIEARLCDTITIANESDTTRALMFGTHDKLETYAGEMGETIRKGRNKLITLTESGTHQFHDHSSPEITGSFTVKP